MSAAEDDLILGKAFDARLAWRLSVFLRPHLALTVWACATLAVAQTAFLCLPVLLGKIVDGVREGAGGTGGTVALYTGVVLAAFAANVVQAYLTSLLGAHVVREIRGRMFAHIQRLPMAVFDRTPVGRWVTRVTNDVEAISQLFTTGIVVAFGDLLLLGGIVAVLFWVDARLAVVAMGTLPFLVVATVVFRTRARDAFRRVRMHLARVNAYLAESIGGAAVTLLFNRQGENAARFARLADAHLSASLASVRIHALYVPVVTLLTGASIAASLGAGGWLVARGEVTLGAFVTFLWLLAHFVNPVQDLAEKYTIFQAAMASAERIFRILDTPQEESSPPLIPHPASRIPSKGVEIVFDRVTFAYDREPVLRNLSFRIAPGERVAFVGSTGSGKTTIVNLLARFYDPQSGTIRIDGEEIALLPRGWARERVALVSQDPVIFSGTIRENVRLAEAGLTEGAVREAARRVRADRFIERLPGRYDAPLPERGSTLSAGQRQLLTYARAVAFDRPVLVLDEATAHIDPETEGLIAEGLEALMAGRTTIVIAHRLATLQQMDRIFVLGEGRLVEQGTNAELLSQAGFYARLHARQYA